MKGEGIMLEYEIIDNNKYIRFKNNPFKLNVAFLPILGTFLMMIALIGLMLVFSKNIIFILCALIIAYGAGSLGLNFFTIYKVVKKNE